MKFSKSLDYLSRAEKVIPLGTQTFSKSYRYLPKGASPVYLERGEGSHVWDVDGNEYIDFICGLGPITLGYNYPRVNDAIRAQLNSGIIFSLPHPLEVELSELLVDIIPCAEMVRFSKTGSEVTSAAIKAARTYTGRDHIAFRGYHGWHDWYSVSTERPGGIPNVYGIFVHQFEYNNIKSLETLFGLYPKQIAAVIMEPVIIEPPAPNFLEQVKELTHKNGALLIWDEIVTGFRWALGGAQEYFNVIPDLATIGKGMANGMPLNAIVGKREIMQKFGWDEKVFFSTTFGGECLSLAAGLATIQEMIEKHTINHCWNLGTRLMWGLQDIKIETLGYPCRPMIVLPDDNPEVRSLWMQELIKRGILAHSSLILNLCFSHTEEDIDKTLGAFEDSQNVISRGQVKLEGEIISSGFRRL